MSTLIMGYPVELPEGVTAWWARGLSDGNLNGSLEVPYVRSQNTEEALSPTFYFD